MTFVHTNCLLGDELARGEHLGEQLEVREAVLLEQRARQLGDRQVERTRARAASSNTSAVVDSYWKRPVSHTSAAYRQTAASRVSGSPSASMRRRTSTPLAAASGSITLIVP